jgi:membrane fusion protein (multidrug efflux system)
MKQIAVIISFSLLVACSPGGTDEKKAELDSYRQKVEEYNQKIAELEAELESEQADPEALELLPVEIKEMSPEFFARYFEVTGVMEALNDAYISPEINGQIQSIAVERGARVRKGDLILKLNTDVTEKTMEEVKTSLELAQRVFTKQEELWKQNIGSELQYLEAKNGMESLEARLATLQQQLQMAHVTAPFSGIIDDIMVKEGELASPGIPLVHLVNLSNMRVSANVSESYLSSISQGDQVELRFPAYPGMLIKAGVTRLGKVIDPQTRTFTLEVEMKNPGEKLKPNMLTSVRIQDYRNEQAMVVPSFILRQDFNGTFLFKVVEENGVSRAKKSYVKRGITVQDQTQITEGLSSGDVVVTKGFNLVSDGTPLSIVQP